MTRWLRVRTRLDRAVAAVLLVFAAPVLAVLGVVVKRDRGPAFVRVPRVGRGGRELGMWKVRTMRATGPGGLAGGDALTAKGDDRITPVGRRIRRARVDELPQLWNIVRGEMAILGPRPEAPVYVDLEDDGWQRVLAMPPGIGGPTQLLVNRWEADALLAGGADDVYRSTILPVKVGIDAWYVTEATPLVDALVVVGLATGRCDRLRRIVERRVPAAAAIPRRAGG